MTLDGLKRRGYTPESINNFIDCIGTARRGNENVVDCKVLEWHLRKHLDEICPRSFCVLEPVRLVVKGVPENFTKEFDAELFPGKPERGIVKLPFSNEIFIDKSDFSDKDLDGFWGLSPSQIVMLRYAVYIKIEDIVRKADGTVDFVHVSIIDKPDVKPKGYIHWVDAKRSITVETRLFDNLFNVDNAKDFGDDWMDHYNKNSIVINSNSKWFDLYKDVKPYDRFQF